jgi:hypothetical protein
VHPNDIAATLNMGFGDLEKAPPAKDEFERMMFMQVMDTENFEPAPQPVDKGSTSLLYPLRVVLLSCGTPPLFVDVACVLIMVLGIHAVIRAFSSLTQKAEEAKDEAIRAKKEHFAVKRDKENLKKHAMNQHIMATNAPKETGENQFANQIRKVREAAEREAAENAAKPRIAWLGKQRFSSTPTQFFPDGYTPPKLRCWFGSHCGRCGSTDHKGKYLHPGDEAWFDQEVVLSIAGATEETMRGKRETRMFLLAGGRGEFITVGKAGKFLKEYSGLPSTFLSKVKQLGAVPSTDGARIRKEQFLFGVQVVEAIDAETKRLDGMLTVDDLVIVDKTAVGERPK